MSLQEQIVSHENKRLLWGIMIENNMFDRIHNTYEKTVRSDFENKLQQIASSVRPNDSILNVNKQIIVQMMEDVKKYTIPVQNNTNNTLVTSEEILTKKQAQFQKGLQTKQDEFNKLIQPVKPTTIDFSDKIDDDGPIGSEMENRVAQAIAWREQQLSQVLEKQDTAVASEWINGGQQKGNQTSSPKVIKANVTGPSASITGPSASITGPSASPRGGDGGTNRIMGVDGGHPRNIKIGDATQMDERNIINVKKVSFLETVEPYSSTDASDSFMDKLKKKDTSTELKTEFGALKTEFGALKTEFGALKTEFGALKTFITENINQLMETHKLLLQQQSKIIDTLDRMSFNIGTI